MRIAACGRGRLPDAAGGGSLASAGGARGAIAQSGERLNGIQEVGGSTPPGSTTPPSPAVAARSGPSMTRAKARVLVTGGAGYIGSHAVLAFREAGYPVAVLDDLSAGHRAAVPDGVDFIEGDAGDPDLAARTIAERRIGAVAHFAASVSVPESVADPLLYYRNNSVASANLVRACIDGGVKLFVFSSTAAVYGAPRALPVSEALAPDPINPYGRSKLVTEWTLRDAAAAHDFRFAALRYFNVAGADPGGRAGQAGPKAGHLIAVACEAALGLRDGVTVHGADYPTADGTGVRDYIHVSDLARVHVAALDSLAEGAEGGVFNCGYGRGFSVREVLAAVEAEAGTRLRVRDGPRRPGDPPALVADASRLGAAMRWSPRHDDLRVIVRTALAWRRSPAFGFGAG